MDNSRRAFPVPADNYAKGMTKREWFAGLAMQALLASRDPGSCSNLDRLTQQSRRIADGLLKELNGKEDECDGKVHDERDA